MNILFSILYSLLHNYAELDIKLVCYNYLTLILFPCTTVVKNSFSKRKNI